MRCKKLIAALLAAVFLLAASMPAVAGDGSHKGAFDVTCEDHPWQDEATEDAVRSTKTPLALTIGSFTFTIGIAIPFTKNSSRAKAAPTSTKTTQNEQSKVEKRK